MPGDEPFRFLIPYCPCIFSMWNLLGGYRERQRSGNERQSVPSYHVQFVQDPDFRPNCRWSASPARRKIAVMAERDRVAPLLVARSSANGSRIVLAAIPSTRYAPSLGSNALINSGGMRRIVPLARSTKAHSVAAEASSARSAARRIL